MAKKHCKNILIRSILLISSFLLSRAGLYKTSYHLLKLCPIKLQYYNINITLILHESLARFQGAQYNSVFTDIKQHEHYVYSMMNKPISCTSYMIVACNGSCNTHTKGYRVIMLPQHMLVIFLHVFQQLLC